MEETFRNALVYALDDTDLDTVAYVWRLGRPMLYGVPERIVERLRDEGWDVSSADLPAPAEATCVSLR